ncbi:MAG: hypothetical protein V5A36_02865 [Natronomonas sp.]
MANEDLHKPLKSINKTASKIRQRLQKIQGEVKKIRKLIEKSTDKIHDAIQDSIHAQAELKLMEHVMDVRSVRPQIEAEHEQITAERGELQERLESIDERYQRKHAELDETAQERIRDVGEHIFEIDEEQFEAGIEEPFTSQVTTAWQVLQEHNTGVREERTSVLRETSGDVVQSIYDYIDRQERLVEDIDEHRIGEEDIPLPSDREEQLQVPYYVVEYEVDGVTERTVVVPSRLTSEGSEWCSVALSPIEGADSLLSGVGVSTDAVEQGVMNASDIEADIEPHAESSLGLSYTDAFAEAIPDDGVSVAVEGGDE